MGALFTPHCARVQPAKLVGGLARVVEGMGVAIYEQTEVTDIKAGRAITDRGDVRAPVILRCLEGFTATMPGRPSPPGPEGGADGPRPITGAAASPERPRLA